MKRLVIRKSLMASIIAIFIVTNIITVVIFAGFISTKEQISSNRYAEKSMQEIVSEKAKLMAVAFDRIETQTDDLALYVDSIIEHCDYPPSLSDEYFKNSDGTLSRHEKKDLDKSEYTNVYVPASCADNAEVIKKVNLTEELDKAFSQVVTGPNMSWVYISTEKGLLRCAPYANLNKFFTANHQQKNDNFYYEANEKNNPDRSAVWTSPYNDYLGRGWTITCSKPIYDRNDNFFGVVSIDLSMNSIQKRFFSDFDLGKTGTIYWINKDGQLRYDSRDNEKNVDQGQLYKKNIFDGSNRQRSEILKEALASESGLSYYMDGFTEKMIAYSKIGNTGDMLIISMDTSEFKVPFTIDMGGLGFICFVNLVMALLFGLLIYRKYSLPMKNLINTSQEMAKGNMDVAFTNDDMSYYEVFELGQAFNAMNKSVKASIDVLVERNKEIDTILKTIDEGLMIVDKDCNRIIQSKEIPGITQSAVNNAIVKLKETKEPYEEQVLVNGEMFSNTYYPLVSKDGVLEKAVISSDCITSKLLLEKEMLQIEKMAGIGQISAAIVHELKNKLALIKGAMYIINISDVDHANEEEVFLAMKAIKDAENVIDTLLDFSKSNAEGGEHVHIGTIVHQITLLSNKELISRNISVEADIPDEIFVLSSGREAMKVIIQNVFNNAMQAIEENGLIKISCIQDELNTKISIWNDGGEIKIEPVEKVFDPFVTTKEEGTGIGLWITRKLVLSLGGSISILTPAMGETQFDIVFPTNGISG